MSSAKLEYTPPNSAKAREQRAELNPQIQAFLNGGGIIKEIPSYNSTQFTPTPILQGANKTRKEMAAARKRGKKKMRKGVMA